MTKKTKIRHWIVLVRKPQQRPAVLRCLQTSKRALSYMRTEKALLFFETQLTSSAVKIFLVVVNLKVHDINIIVAFTSFANRTFKSSGTQTPITFLSKSALTSSTVLTRILNAIALTEETDRCHCYCHYHHYNHFHHPIVNHHRHQHRHRYPCHHSCPFISIFLQ